jgi:type I restriction enzyme S subunit
MRDGWEQVSLGELTTKRVDFSPIVASTEYPVVGVQRSGWGLLARDVGRGDSMKFSKLMRLNANDLVYRVITAFEAPSTVVDASFAGSYVTPQTFPVFRIDSSRLLPGFMRLHTTSPVFHEAMSERCTGTVLRRKTISVGAFQSIPINLPPLAEQRRIVDLIGSLDKAIEEADKFGQIARDGLDAVADSMIFTKVKWPEATVHGVAEKRGLVGGPFGSS